MIVVSRGRGEGKTTEILRFFAANPGSIIVTSTFNEAGRLVRLAKGLGIEDAEQRIVSFSSVMTGALRGRPSVPVYVDNADWILESLLGRRISALSVTGGAW